MIAVIGRLTMNPDIMDTYESDLAVMIPKVLTEDGCHYYALHVEDKVKGTVAVTEMWRNEAALLAHFGQPWIVEFMEKYGSAVLGSTLKVYDLADERDLPGM